MADKKNGIARLRGMLPEVCKPQPEVNVSNPAALRYRYGGVGRWMHPPDTTTMQEIHTEEKVATLRAVDQKQGKAFAASSRKTPNGNVFGTYNSVGHQVPLFNLLWAFFGGRKQGTTWLQLSTLMENIAIVSALMLALVITFHSAFSFDEIVAADDRFHQDLDGSTFGGAGVYRTVAKMDFGDSYARWWHGGMAGQNGGSRMGNCDEPTSPECRTSGRKSRASEDFNATCLASECFLTLSLLLAVMVLSTGGITTIGRPSVDTSGHQFSRVMESYMQFVRLVVVVTLFAALVGLFLFFSLIKLEVFLKFPDFYVETHANSGAFPASPTSFYTSIYGFTHAAVVFFTFFPLFVFGWILSAGQRAVYSFPVEPLTDFLEPEDERQFSRAALTEFLVKTCRLSKCGVNKTPNQQGDDDGSTDLAAYREFVFLTAAGGARSSEAELLADHLYDAGIRTVQELILFVKTGDDEIYNIPGVSMMAASQIIWSVNANLDEVWYSQPENAFYFKAKSGEDTKYPSYILKTAQQAIKDGKKLKLAPLDPCVNKLTQEERAMRQSAETLVGGGAKHIRRGNENLNPGDKLAWNGYLCEYVPDAGNLVTPPTLDSNVRVEPFSAYKTLMFGQSGGIADTSIWDTKLKKAWNDWGIYILLSDAKKK